MSEPTTSPVAAAGIAALLAQKTAAREQVTTNYVSWLVRFMAAFEQWYRPADLRAFSREAAGMSLQSQRASAAQAVEFQRMALQLLGGDPGARFVPALPPDGLREADPLEVWERPAETYRYARSVGFSEEEALTQATTRAETMAITDVALGAREGDRQAFEKSPADIRGYRRVLRPELSKTGVCGLCVVASDRLYFKAELKDIHDRCRCEALPILGDLDPGSSVNREDLEKLYAAAKSTNGRELKRIRVTTINHGELGPMLVPERSAKTVIKAPVERREVTPKDPSVVIAALEKAAARMEANIAAGDRALEPALARTRERLDALRS